MTADLVGLGGDATELDRKGVALAFMKRASRDTFRVCAKSAGALADQIEDGQLRLDAPSALRMLAIMFDEWANRQ